MTWRCRIGLHMWQHATAEHPDGRIEHLTMCRRCLRMRDW